MGDALAVALMKARNFQAHHFARFHPGGSLGRRLLQRVRDEMRSWKLPFVAGDAAAESVLAVISEGGLGIALVTGALGNVRGIITDGDLRRALQVRQSGFFSATAEDLMTPDPVTIGVDSNMSAALELMARHEITLLVVVDDQRVVGVVQK
jgi:arabinose-5-phosphate isomerase